METIQLRSHLFSSIAIGLYLVGMLFFLCYANFDEDGDWDKLYYVWDMSKDSLFLLGLNFALKEFRPVIMPVLIFSILRLCWEIIIIFIKIDPTTLTNILWATITGVITIISIKQLKGL